MSVNRIFKREVQRQVKGMRTASPLEQRVIFGSTRGFGGKGMRMADVKELGRIKNIDVNGSAEFTDPREG